MRGVAVVLLFGAAVVFGLYELTAWQWRECRKVGHGVLYCITKGLE